MGKKIEAEGNKVIYIRIASLKPKIFSRLEGVSLTLTSREHGDKQLAQLSAK